MSSQSPRVKAVTDPVYHYTDSAGLIGIAQHHVLWASEAASLNDRAEVRQGWEKIRAWLNRQPPSDVIDLLKHHAAKPDRASHEVFVVSGSTRGDDANQWRLYAGRGAGYAIEFDPKERLTVITGRTQAPQERATPGRAPFVRGSDFVEVSPWSHVIYDDNEVDAALTKLAAETTAAANDIANSHAHADDKSIGFENLRDNSYSDLATIAHLIKEPGFSGENEVRIVVTFAWGGSHIKFRSGTYGVVGYLELGSPKCSVARLGGVAKEDAGSLPLRSVRIGPLLHKDHVASIESFLRNCNPQDVAVTVSQVALR